MKKNTWRQDTLARDLRDACDDMRRWMQLDPTDLAQMSSSDLLAMADVAMRVYDATHLVIDDRRRYLGELRAGNLVPYTETVVAGGPVSNVVLDFTAGVKGN